MKTKLILEAGCNHQGSIDIAVDMIVKASILGAWGIKFQKRDIESIPEDVKIQPRDMSNSFGKNYYEHRQALEFSLSRMKELKKISENHGLKFICSAFDLQSVIDLVEIECKHIKLPSQLYTDKLLQKELIAAKRNFGYNLYVSTGMHSAEEILSNSWLDNADVIFHCVSAYPCELKEMNLIFIKSLQSLSHFHNRYSVGYSSHDYLGLGIPYAIAAGAEYIERHFTIDKKWKGSDHSTVSSDYNEVKKIVEEIELMESMLGDEKRECNEREKKIRRIYRGF